MDPQIESWLRQRIHNPRVLARVLEANRGTKAGDMIRGWHRKPGPLARWGVFRMARGEVIRRYGRTAWGALPRGLIHKDGRRMSVSATAVAVLRGIPPERHGRLRELWARQFPGRAWASDGCGVEVRAVSPGEWDSLHRT